MTDLIVVGGGPVGLATALFSHRLGLDVIVYERRSGVIDKACGEGLMPGGLRRLRDLGVDPEGHALTGIDYLSPTARRVSAHFETPGRGVRRTALHAALREAVLCCGIRVVQASIDPRRDVRIGLGHVVVAGERARWVVGADGLHSRMRTLVPPAHAAHRQRNPTAGGLLADWANDQRGRTRGWLPRRFGQRAHLRTSPWTSQVEVHFGRGVEAYLTPVAPDLLGVAVLSARRAPFPEHLTRLGAIGARLLIEPADRWGSVAGAGPLWQPTSRKAADPVFLVGDAAGYIDALTGEGISLGLVQAERLVACLVAGQSETWEQEWSRLTRGHRLATGALTLTVSVPGGRAAVMGATTAAPRAFDAAVGIMAGS